MERKNYVVAIDLGTSNVVIAVGEPTAEGVALAALVSKPCQGVNAGQVENIELVARAIDEAKEEIRRQLGIRITEAYVGISGPYVRCASHSDYVFTADKLSGVSQADVDHLFDRMRNVQAPGDEVVMERIPQNYMTDNNVEVKNPVGSFSGKLSSTFNFILCAQTPIQRLELAMKRCGIILKEVFTNAQVLPDALLSPEDKEEGAAVINIGGGVTDVAVYSGNVLRYVAVIPMGGNAINRDIRSQSIAEKHVEPLKCRYGSAMAELVADTLVHIAGRTPRESKDIPRRNLATIIEARLKDIIDYVLQELKNSGYGQKLGYGLVLSGGSALLPEIDELFRRTTGMEVRIGTPEEGLTEDSREAVHTPQCATDNCMLLSGSQKGR
ncbi:MAG: cell division protein FtsA, partial [Alistipes sp.]|nr:cell division protein FtsA [Alistipes sp.]